MLGILKLSLIALLLMAVGTVNAEDLLASREIGAIECQGRVSSASYSRILYDNFQNISIRRGATQLIDYQGITVTVEHFQSNESSPARLNITFNYLEPVISDSVTMNAQGHIIFMKTVFDLKSGYLNYQIYCDREL